MISDNSPQFIASEMKAFTSSFSFEHIPNNPHYPQSNSQEESTVKTVKALLESANDPWMALLSYKATPFPWCGLRSAEPLMGRLVRTTVPQVDKQLPPTWSYIPMFWEKDEQFTVKQKKNHDCRHRVHELRSIPDNQPVLVRTRDKITSGRVISQQRLRGTTLSAPLQDRHAETNYTWLSNRLNSRTRIYQL